METEIDRDLKKIRKLERTQARYTKYISTVGKLLLFALPLVLVIITILAILSIVRLVDIILDVIFYVILGLYGLNSLILFLGASVTNKTLKKRLQFERKRGRPIDSLDGFDLLFNNVKRVINLLKFIAIISWGALGLFISMLIIDLIELGYAGIGFALFGFGLALLVRSLNLKISDVNGLQDFYKPTTHQIFLDNFFADVTANHLDPVTLLKWDDYKLGLNLILNPTFARKVKETEAGEVPINFALEKILYLFYLRYQDVLDEARFLSEMKEVINVDAKNFSVENGLLIEDKWYFGRSDYSKLFGYIKQFNPGFFTIVDRLQLELKDNIVQLSKDDIYMDSSAQEVVFVNGELNIMIYLFNNHPEPKQYRLRIIAPGFDPSEIKLDVKVEGRGSFQIPREPIPLSSSSGKDIVGVLSDMLKNGDTVWLTLEPRLQGEQTIQIFLETADGVIIEGKTRSVKVAKDFKSILKKFTSIGSILGGIATPLSKMILSP